MMRIAFALVVASSLAGCLFGDDDNDCNYGYDRGGAPPVVAYELRDPVTGVCQPYYGGGYDCADPCTPCLQGAGAQEAYPDWGQCYSQCESLDEGPCRSTSGCRAVYTRNAALPQAQTVFYQCWATATSGPIQGGTCTGLDAQSCSQHDDCVAIHDAPTDTAGIGNFQACGPESGGQDPGSCVGAITCLAAEPACPMGTIAGHRNGCWTGYCIPYAQCDTLPACDTLAESECIGRDDCSPIYEGQNCTCNGQSCTCQSWLYDSCKTM